MWGIDGDWLPFYLLVVSVLCGGLEHFGISTKQCVALGGDSEYEVQDVDHSCCHDFKCPQRVGHLSPYSGGICLVLLTLQYQYPPVSRSGGRGGDSSRLVHK